MRSRTLGMVVAVLAFLAGVAVTASAEYDKAAVQEVMQNNAALYPRLSAAASSGEYMEAAGYLLSIAQGMYSIKDFSPSRGEKAAWDATMTDFLNNAFLGLAACATQDQAALKSAVAKLAQDRNQGHAAHR